MEPCVRWEPGAPMGSGNFGEHLPAHCEVSGTYGVRHSYSLGHWVAAMVLPFAVSLLKLCVCIV